MLTALSIIGGVFAALIVILLILGWMMGGWMQASPRKNSPHYDDRDSFRTPDDLGLTAERVIVPTPDGLDLVGWYIPAKDGPNAPALVCMHGGRDDKRYFLPLGPALHAAGYAVLLVDGRCHGESPDNGVGLTLGLTEKYDVIGGVDYLEARGHAWVGALGCSQGGASVVLAAAEEPRIKALLLESTGYYIGRPLEMIAERQIGFAPKLPARILTMTAMLRLGFPLWDALTGRGTQYRVAPQLADRPVFMLHGGRDDITSLADFERYSKLFGPNTRTWVCERGKHCILRRALDDYAPMAVEFFGEVRTGK